MRIRAWQKLQGLQQQGLAAPIIALSAYAMREAVRVSMEAGGVAHLAKRMDKEMVLKTIERFGPRPGAQSQRAARHGTRLRIPAHRRPGSRDRAGRGASDARRVTEQLDAPHQFLKPLFDALAKLRGTLA